MTSLSFVFRKFWFVIGVDTDWNSTLGHQREDLIMDCTYRNHRCEFNTSFHSPYLGNCFMANWNGTMQASKAGPYYGGLFHIFKLVMVVDSQSSEIDLFNR